MGRCDLRENATASDVATMHQYDAMQRRGVLLLGQHVAPHTENVLQKHVLGLAVVHVKGDGAGRVVTTLGGVRRAGRGQHLGQCRNTFNLQGESAIDYYDGPQC